MVQVILSHHMLAGLKGFKMSKSDPDAAIFMEDTEAEVSRKIKKAYCPEKLLQEEIVNDKGVKETKTNGCIEYVKYLVLPKLGKFEVEFQAGCSKTYTQFEEVVADYTDGAHSSKLTVSCSHSFSQSNSVPYVCAHSRCQAANSLIAAANAKLGTKLSIGALLLDQERWCSDCYE